ncbi:MAG: tetratricopeptide repeat protein [Verrucomicrobiales bacterium]|nr:tetratricopeptide repeat protein [Verrucomicrobiales bacterium]
MNAASSNPGTHGPRTSSWAFRLSVALLSPVIFLVLVELGLRLVGYGHPTTYFIPAKDSPDRLYENPAFGHRFFPAGLLRVPPPTTFSRTKAPGTIRVLIFGESAAMGDPKPSYGVARYLEVLLRERHPGVIFEVIPVAMTAINSHALVPMAEECASLGADFWIVYAGNNEVLGPFGAGSTLGSRSPPRWLVHGILAAKATRLGQAITSLSRLTRGGGEGSTRWAGVRVLAGEQVTETSPERARVYESFDANLRDIAAAGARGGAKVMLSTVAVNLADCGPFGSVHRTDLTDAQRADWQRHFEAGCAILTNAPDPATTQALQQAATLDPAFAATEFLRGCLALAGSNLVQATEHFERARDLDTIPLRTDSRLNSVTRKVASELGLPLVDAVKAMAEASTQGIPGDDFFYEHVHLTPDGNFTLARAFAEAVAKSCPAEIQARAQGEWASPETCATRLALTPWNRAAGVELMLRRCLDAPFTNRINHAQHVRALASEAARLRRAQTPESAGFVRGIYTNALAQAPHDAHLLRNYAEFLEATGDLANAAIQWKDVIGVFPEHPVAYLQAGSLLRRQGKIDDARPLIEKATVLQPDWIDAWLELADLSMARGRPTEAIAACRQALSLQPDHARAHLKLADGLAGDRQGEAALAELVEAVRLDPRLWEARYLLGVEYALKDKINEAQAQFEEVVRLKPDHARGHFNLGIALARQQQWESAGRHLAEALRLDPRNDEARKALAQIAAIQRQQAPAPAPVAPNPQ